MIKLNDRAWGSFRLDELFKISRGRLAKKPIDIGEVPYISSSGMNNGLNESFNIDCKYIVRADLSPVITVANNGSVGSTFVQEFAFSASSDVSILEPIFDSNTYALFFIKVVIERNKNLYGYGRKWGLEKMRSSIIKLPALESGEPDWQFMEDYIKQFEETKLLEIQETNYKDNVTLPSVDEWGSFRLSDLFEITLAKPFFLDKTFDQTDISGTPYITRSSFNNGLVNRLNLEIIDNSLKLINAGNCLTVGAEGKKAFYQNNDFIAGNKVTILRNRNISKPNYFFIIVVLDMAMKEVFSYGRAATYGRLIDLNINLPSKDGKPDWELMEIYIKSLPYSEMI